MSCIYDDGLGIDIGSGIAIAIVSVGLMRDGHVEEAFVVKLRRVWWCVLVCNGGGEVLG
jgi:hypothetical protein